MGPICPECHKKPIGVHKNSKYCKPCALELRKRPKTTLTMKEIKRAKRLIGTMPRDEVAKKLGTSLSNLKRAFPGFRMSYYNYCQKDPNLVRRVSSYYEKHGLKLTSEKFSLSCKQVDHIIYRYKQAKPRQVKWKDKEIIELAKMAGLVSKDAQAKYFGRPRANAGSITSVWSKKMGTAQKGINGMEHYCAKHLVTQRAKYIRPIGASRNGKPVEHIRLLLWVDMEKCLKSNVPRHIKSSIKSLAMFQKWLHGEDAKRNIKKMIKEREL